MTTLRELSVGDKFVHAKDKSKLPVTFEVVGNPKFSVELNSSAKECRHIPTGLKLNKRCSLQVKKIEA